MDKELLKAVECLSGLIDHTMCGWNVQGNEETELAVALCYTTQKLCELIVAVEEKENTK